MDRVELMRLLNFKKITNSPVWICFIAKENTSIGHFWHIDTLFEYSFCEDKEFSTQYENHRRFEAMDPIVIPYDWSIARKVDFSRNT
jgi:hypothetical protein